MKRLLFVDHAFHQTTRSADFFTQILDTAFDVQTWYLEPDRHPGHELLDAAREADIVLLWQKDFLAPLFLAMGKPVVVIPMFDGSGGMPDLHWLFAHRARFLNFSLTLHERIRMAGGSTMLLRYWPEPVAEELLPRFDQLNAFFWQRRPDHGIDFPTIDKLLGQAVDRLHVHDAADIPGSFTPRARADATYTLTRSTWFKDRAEYHRCLARANIFVAPRVAEGIGMALLEAMAAGKLVIAHGAPTNSEYVANWVNGILFHKDRPGPLNLHSDDASRMARTAWRSVVDGRRQWLASHPAILDWIDTASAPPPIELDHAAFLRELWDSYFASLQEYVAFLTRNIGLLCRLTGLPFGRLLDIIGEARPPAAAVPPELEDADLSPDGLLDLTREDNRHIGPGWSVAEAGWRWALGHNAELRFTGLEPSEGDVGVTFTASSLRELGRRVQCTITLNDTVVFRRAITRGWSDYGFTFPARLLQDRNKLVLTFDKATRLRTDQRLLSVCFRQFTFATDANANRMIAGPRSLAVPWARGWSRAAGWPMIRRP
jgi:hypothetical protein